MKAARSPLFEAGGKRRRAPAGAEGAPRGAPAGASAQRRRRRDVGPSAPGRSLTIEAATPLASGIVTRTGGAALWSVMDRRNDRSDSGRKAPRARPAGRRHYARARRRHSAVRPLIVERAPFESVAAATIPHAPAEKCGSGSSNRCHRAWPARHFNISAVYLAPRASARHAHVPAG